MCIRDSINAEYGKQALDQMAMNTLFCKLIVCQVRPENKKLFSRGQLGWSSLCHEEHFVAQCGGWSCNPSDGRECATIVQLWESFVAYEKFMAPGAVHDQLLEASSQAETFESCVVKLFSSTVSSKDILSGITEATYLSIAEEASPEARVSLELHPITEAHEMVVSWCGVQPPSDGIEIEEDWTVTQSERTPSP
eukprot:TRINITY_DN3484_c0_g1_i1.p1 TRINITY_DN3484_c0_g1~~TRINITY_DN3484_c0_g1_i1.p1  ORF type:complete len:194 (-),score=52.69 TRINITY_DN3484_c0_g1_i1:307-888(-)